MSNSSLDYFSLPQSTSRGPQHGGAFALLLASLIASSTQPCVLRLPSMRNLTIRMPLGTSLRQRINCGPVQHCGEGLDRPITLMTMYDRLKCVFDLIVESKCGKLEHAPPIVAEDRRVQVELVNQCMNETEHIKSDGLINHSRMVDACVCTRRSPAIMDYLHYGVIGEYSDAMTSHWNFLFC